VACPSCYEGDTRWSFREGAIGASVRWRRRYLQSRFFRTAPSTLPRRDRGGQTRGDGRVFLRSSTLPCEAGEPGRSDSLAGAHGRLDQPRRPREARGRSCGKLSPSRGGNEVPSRVPRGAVARCERFGASKRAMPHCAGRRTHKKDFGRSDESSTSRLPTILEKRMHAPKRPRRYQRCAGRGGLVGENDVAARFGIWDRDSHREDAGGGGRQLLKMEERLEQRVVGQEDAVRPSRAVASRSVGLRDPGKPIGSFHLPGAQSGDGSPSASSSCSTTRPR